MKKDRFLIFNITTVLFLLFFMGLNLNGCNPDTPEEYAGPTENLKIGLAPYIADFYGLIFLADIEDFFGKNGLDITFVRMESGPDAMKALRQGRVDMGTGTEFPFTREVLGGSDVKVIATVWHGENLYLAGRRDRGIRKPSDFRGKKVAVASGTQLEFFLGRYLLYQGITLADIEIIDTNLHSLLATFLSGDADGVVFVKPDLKRARREFEDLIEAWSITDEQPTYAVVACRDKFVKSQPEIIRRFLKSLREAELYFHNNPQQGRTKIAGHPARKDSPYGEGLPLLMSYELLLDKPFLVMLEDEARWLIDRRESYTRDVPNFLEFIYFDGLESVKPEGISIVR